VTTPPGARRTSRWQCSVWGAGVVALADRPHAAQRSDGYQVSSISSSVPSSSISNSTFRWT
jgi:hypothetical protein